MTSHFQHTLAAIDAERTSLMRVEVLRRRTAEVLQVRSSEGRDSRQTQVIQSVQPLKQIVDGGYADLLAVGEMDPLEG